MTPDELQLLAELAADLLAADRADDLVADLIGSGMADEVWADDEALAVLFGAHGRSAATSVLLDYAVLQPQADLLGRVLLPAAGSTQAPGRVERDSILVDGLLLAAGPAERFAVGTDSGELVLVPASALDLTAAPGFDPELRVATVRGVVERSATEPLPGSGSVPSPDWATVSVRIARALAFELIGIAGALLDRAVAHVTERQQFGRPLAAFQVVRHRLAAAAIARTGAEELALASGPDVGRDAAVLIVKAVAGRAALQAAQEAQQVCGGMGFTEEFGLHRLVRRAYLLDSMLGGSEAAEFELGALAIAHGRVPDLAVAL